MNIVHSILDNFIIKSGLINSLSWEESLNNSDIYQHHPLVKYLIPSALHKKIESVIVLFIRSMHKRNVIHMIFLEPVTSDILIFTVSICAFMVSLKHIYLDYNKGYCNSASAVICSPH